jgi:putative exosortase-associated protein (TIGR04073 family)
LFGEELLGGVISKSTLYNLAMGCDKVDENRRRFMRNSLSLWAVATGLVVLATGCAGPERKLGRGILNATEFARQGEIQRSMEQAALWENTEAAYTTGFIRGFNRSLARTAVGVYEIVTFPIPDYDPVFLPEYPVYPDSYRPQLLADPIFSPDTNLGFTGGDVAPFFPGSRFRIFER